MRKFNILTAVILIFPFLGLAQNGTVTTGGDASSNGGSIAYSVGQVFVQTVDNGNHEVSEGVQKAVEIYTVSTGDKNERSRISLYPNPALENIVIQYQGNASLNYRFYDAKGKLIDKGTTEGGDAAPIDVSAFAPGIYQVIVFDGKQQQEFKLIKQ